MPTTPTAVPRAYLMPSLAHATVADAMHPGILSCSPEATLTEVAQLMSDAHVHSLAVAGTTFEAGGETLAWGIISQPDVLAAALAGGAEASAAALAGQPAVAVPLDMPLRDAVRVMLADGLTHIVVLDRKGERPVGVLSMTDVTRIIAWGGD